MDSHPPPKPWERRIPGAMGVPLNFRSTDFGPSAAPSTSIGPPVLTRMVPPVPPRPVQQSYRPSYSSFNSSYSPYGSSIYGGYSPYSYGGSYGMGGYGRLPHTEDVAPSRFVQQAEESSRGAFQSIESIVQAFASVSMMLDATFSAVYNSFRAVLDVANHLTRLRTHLTRVLSAFALVRTLRYFYRRLLRLLGRASDTDVEDLWADSTSDALATSSSRGFGAGTEDQSVKSWPIFLFFAVVLGGPYLIWKLLSSSPDSEENATNWASGEDDHVVARAEYDFSAASEQEIPLRAGDMLNLAPKEQQPRMRGWLLASVDGQTTGLVPANYVKVLGKRRGRKQAEMERLAQTEQETTEASQATLAAQPQSISAQDFTPDLSTASTSGSAEQLLESVYRETPASYSLGTSISSMPSSTVLNIPEKTDL
ncbi:peroxisome biogenesis factor 13 [Leuresthes tenuis]|uniref:peroxisome biogenesis factor 13 n=1 Tax=Leuresthes tenuis TaxID=355514 RepID=UPI003B50EE75